MKLTEDSDPEQLSPWRQIRVMQQRLAQDPERVEDWLDLGHQLLQIQRMEDAAKAFIQAANLQPNNASILSALGTLYCKLSRPDEAIQWFEKAVAAHPNDLLLHLNLLFVLPVIPESDQQIHRFRRRCHEGVELLLNSDTAFTCSHFSSFSHTFYLMYHHCNDLDLLNAYGTLLSRVVDPYPFGPAVPRQGLDRIRIGFLSGFFCEHSNTQAFEGWIRHLDRNRFEPVLIHLHDRRIDAVSQRLDAQVEQVVTLSASLPKAQQQLHALELDLLFYTDIGMHPMVSMLACSRLAPVQLTGWGVPQTSGMPMIDYYISGSLVEAIDADALYSEKLVRVPGLPCCYLDDELAFEPRDRDYFFLPSDGPLIGCPQALWKLPPSFDATLEEIARRVPDAYFVFVESDISHYSKLFVDRLRQSAPQAHDRLILLSRMGRSDFMALVSQLDLLLDPPNFSSGVTLFDVLHTGTPFVALEGPYLRSRFVAGAYRLIGLNDPPIVSDMESYVALVERLLNQPEELSKLRTTIAELAREQLYNRMEGLRYFEAFALDALAKARHPKGRHQTH